MIETEDGMACLPEGVDTEDFEDGEAVYILQPEELEDGTLLLPMRLDDGNYESVPYVQKEVADAERDELAERLQAAEKKIEALKSQMENMAPAPSFRIPCAFCGEYVYPSAQYVRSNCCQRVSHVRCLLYTMFRNGSRFQDDKCTHCLIEEAKNHTERYRAVLIGEYAERCSKKVTPPNRVMLRVCMACGHLKDKHMYLNPGWKWTQEHCDTVYSVYSTLTKEDLLENELTVETLRELDLSLHFLIKDFKVTRDDLFYGTHEKHFNMTHGDISRAADEAAALVGIGIDAAYMKYRGLTLQKLMDMRLHAEAMCIFGFTMMELIVMKLQKDQVKRFNFTLDQWVCLLNLNRRCLYLLHIRESDFRPGNHLGMWDMSGLAAKLKLRQEEMRTLFEKDKQRQQLSSSGGERYNMQIIGKKK